MKNIQFFNNLPETDEDGKTWLHQWAEASRTDQLRHHVSSVRTHVNDVTPQGYTPLMLASSVQVVRFLLEHGAEPNLIITTYDGYENSAIMEYCENQQVDALNALLDHCNADRNLKCELLNTPVGGDTPLIAAARLGHLDVCRALLVHGADPSKVSLENRTALEIANEALATLNQNSTERTTREAIVTVLSSPSLPVASLSTP